VHTIWGFAAAAVIMAFGLLVSGDRLPSESSHGFAPGQLTTTHAWLLGVAMGGLAMWVQSVRWHELPIRLRIWFRMNRHGMWLSVLGCAFAGVLFYY
jgi:hypothetical protein